MTIKISWHDHGREPQCKPDPAYPKGKDIRFAQPVERSCQTDLPYPAKRCGLYIVECTVCGLSVGVTTAGRPDDPRSVQLACLEARH